MYVKTVQIMFIAVWFVYFIDFTVSHFKSDCNLWIIIIMYPFVIFAWIIFSFQTVFFILEIFK